MLTDTPSTAPGRRGGAAAAAQGLLVRPETARALRRGVRAASGWAADGSGDGAEWAGPTLFRRDCERLADRELTALGERLVFAERAGDGWRQPAKGWWHERRRMIRISEFFRVLTGLPQRIVLIVAGVMFIVTMDRDARRQAGAALPEWVTANVDWAVLGLALSVYAILARQAAEEKRAAAAAARAKIRDEALKALRTCAKGFEERYRAAATEELRGAAEDALRHVLGPPRDATALALRDVGALASRDRAARLDPTRWAAEAPFEERWKELRRHVERALEAADQARAEVAKHIHGAAFQRPAGSGLLAPRRLVGGAPR